MFDKPVVIDARGHLVGRLASIVAKQLLNGQKVVVVRCEQMDMSGSLMRAKMRYARFKGKKTITNPKLGPIHNRAPSRIFFRVVRGMIPHMKKRCKNMAQRGQKALERLKTFEGIPTPYDTMKRLVCPEALRINKLAPGRKYCGLGRLCKEVGWNYGPLIERLEDARKAASEEFYQTKKAATAAKGKAATKADTSAVDAVLAGYGY